MSVQKFAPVALFCFKRLDHLQRTVQALQLNEGAKETDIHVFSDAPGKEADRAGVEEVRNFIRTIHGFHSVQCHMAPENLGLSRSIEKGVSYLCGEYGKVIVLEDDMETQPFFLRYMNEALNRYQHVEEVISIHAYCYPIRFPNKSFFLQGADCWGWATWERGWKQYNPDGKELLKQLYQGKLTRRFDFNGYYPYTRMLENQTKGLNDSWAVRWYASAFLAGKLTLYPGHSLLRNIGNDSSGTHSPGTRLFEPVLASEMPGWPEKEEENEAARKEFVRFFRRLKWKLILERLGL